MEHSCFVVMAQFEWKIQGTTLRALQLAGPCARISSKSFKMYGHSFVLDLAPKHDDTSKQSYIIPRCIDKANIKFSLVLVISIKEMNAQLSSSWTTDNEKWISLGAIKSDDFQGHNILTVTLETAVTEATDADNTDITHLYIAQEETKESFETSSANRSVESQRLDSVVAKMKELSAEITIMKNELNAVKSRMNEEQKSNSKEDDIAHILQEIDSIKSQLAQVRSANNIVSDPERGKVKEWWENTVKLGQYYGLFIDHGVDDLSTVKLLTMDTIKGMGIDKIGHQMKILNKVIQLKQTETLNKEGGTVNL